MKHFRSLSPHDNSILGKVAITPEYAVREAVAKAREAQMAWREMGLGPRVVALRLVEVFKMRGEEFAQLASREMGMPIAESRQDVEDAIGTFSWYLDNAEKYLAPEVVFENSQEVHTLYREPYGVAGVIVPWNFPASNFVTGCGQSLIAGNTVVFKHSEEVPLCGKLLDTIFAEAGMPPEVFLQIYGRGPAGALLSRQDVDFLCFTGSSEVGRTLYRTAAAGMKRLVMELGGSAPGIVCADADLDEAIGQIYAARFTNAGQICDALKRLIVHESVWDLVIEKLADKLRMITLGDPLNQQFQMGPLVSKRQVDLLERQVADALEKGALVVAGARRPGLVGAYYEPTLLTNITRDMRVWQEEVFGPVLSIIKFSNIDEAIMLANDTQFGLGAYVYTRDTRQAEHIATRVQAGNISVNGVSYVRPTNPFGGYKNSGLGRVNGAEGFHAVTQVKVVARGK